MILSVDKFHDYVGKHMSHNEASQLNKQMLIKDMHNS